MCYLVVPIVKIRYHTPRTLRVTPVCCLGDLPRLRILKHGRLVAIMASVARLNRLSTAFFAKLFIGLSVLFALGACAIASFEPWHAFSFDGKFDGWGGQVDLLEYQYGDKYQLTRRIAREGVQGLGDGVSINGKMPVGDFLYVKWRMKKTGRIFEDRVDLRGKLASSMEGHRVTFVIDGEQLYIYLVSPVVKHESDPPLLRTTESRYHVTYEIYPNNTYKN